MVSTTICIEYFIDVQLFLSDDNCNLRKLVGDLEAQLSHNDWAITTSSTPKPPLLTSALVDEPSYPGLNLPDLSSSDKMLITCPNCVSDKDSADKNSFSFAEFIRLRQENRLLRMQVSRLCIKPLIFTAKCLINASPKRTILTLYSVGIFSSQRTIKI